MPWVQLKAYKNPNILLIKQRKEEKKRSQTL